MAEAPEIRVSPRERYGVSDAEIRSAALPSRYGLQTPFKTLKQQVGRAAISGFGHALGRDVYLISKRLLAYGILVLSPFAFAILSYLGARLLVRRGGWFDYAAGSLAAVAGLAASWVLALFVRHGEDWYLFLDQAETVVLAVFLFTVGAAFGVVSGLRDRELLAEANEVAEHNERFLLEQGIRETGGTDVTHFDGDGNALRFLEAHHDRLLFMAVGRRGRRASILLGQDGRMLAYTGP